MYEMRPLGTGFALSLTAGILYPLCALAVFLWPDAASAFFGALLHGINLIAVTPPSGAPTPWQVFLGFCGIVVVAFVIGIVYAWMHNLVRGLFKSMRR